MGNVIDFKTKKEIIQSKEEQKNISPQELPTEVRRTINLIKKTVFEVICASIPNIDNEWSFLDYLEAGELFESEAIENGGVLTWNEIEICKDMAKAYAPLVDEFALKLRNGVGLL